MQVAPPYLTATLVGCESEEGFTNSFVYSIKQSSFIKAG